MGTLVDGLALGPQSVAPLLGAAVGLGVALLSSLREGELAARSWLALLALCSMLWSLGIAVELSSLDPALADSAARLALAGVAMAGAAVLELSARVTRQRSRMSAFCSGVSLGVSLLIWLVPSLSHTYARPTGGFWVAPTAGVGLAAIASFVPSCIALWLVWNRFRHLPSCRRRRQLGWMLGALCCGMLGGLDLLTMIAPVYPTAWATTTLSTVILFYAIGRDRLMSAQTALQQTVIGLCAAVSAVLIAQILVVLTARHGGRTVGIGAAAAGLYVYQRVWVASIEPSLARLLDWRRRRIDRAWAAFAQQSLKARTPEQAQALLQQALADGLEVELLAVLPADRPRDDEPQALVRAEAVLRERGVPVLRDQLELEGDVEAPALLGAMQYLAADALLPLRREGELVAVAAIAGAALELADETLAADLQRLSAQAALTLRNARLYHEVARRSSSLEAEVSLRTERLERALDALKTAQARLVATERSSSLGLLVAGVSHEINNALNFIYANLPTLATYMQRFDELAAQAPETASLIDARSQLPATIAALGEATRRTRGIVDDLRKFARPDSERRVARVEEGLDAALNLLRPRTAGRIDVARVYGPAPSVDCFPGPLNQCFFNLLLNAVEAARSQIWVTVGEADDGSAVEVVISDDGDGIPADVLDDIFRPFFTTKPQATGLGLTVSQSIVERHGGAINVNSLGGDGATVRVRLPTHAPETRR